MCIFKKDYLLYMTNRLLKTRRNNISWRILMKNLLIVFTILPNHFNLLSELICVFEAQVEQSQTDSHSRYKKLKQVFFFLDSLIVFKIVC